MANTTDFSSARVGDRVWEVRWGWGTVVSIKTDNSYPVNVELDIGGGEFNFTFDGKFESTDLHPSLFWDKILFVVPPRPKRMVKKTLEGWVNVYPEDSPLKTFHFVKDRPHADGLAEQTRIACVHVTGEYEVEDRDDS